LDNGRASFEPKLPDRYLDPDPIFSSPMATNRSSNSARRPPDRLALCYVLHVNRRLIGTIVAVLVVTTFW
jgi:hypothetical protein